MRQNDLFVIAHLLMTPLILMDATGEVKRLKCVLLPFVFHRKKKIAKSSFCSPGRFKIMLIDISRFKYLFDFIFNLVMNTLPGSFMVLPWWCRIGLITKGNLQWFSCHVKQHQLTRFLNTVVRIKMCGSEQFFCLLFIYPGILSLLRGASGTNQNPVPSPYG